MTTRIITQIAFWLVIIGALNWGLVGIVGLNLVSGIFGELAILTRVIYILVGISALWLIVDLFRTQTPLEKIK